MRLLLLTALAAIHFSSAQQVGKKPEHHPGLTTQKCTTHGGCVTQQTSVVLDSLAHPIKEIGTGRNCIDSDGNINKKVCSSAAECAKKCAIQGVNYAQNGINTNGDSMTMRMYLNIDGELQSVSPRVYLLDPNGKDYSAVKLRGQEISFDTDMSNLPCGMNGALYLSAMEHSGGRSKFNPAGATYGTGYCDAQCYNTSAFLNGVANIGHQRGACCNEMDLWEANSRATQLTPHSCNVTGFYACEGAECGEDGVCDKTGCSYNPYGLGAHQYYGLEKKVDTTRPFTVTTQFVTDDGTTSGTLEEIRRLYVQDGEIIQNAKVQFQKKSLDSITNRLCKATADDFTRLGGLAEMGEALGDGMVLIFAIWNDEGGYMNWLDSGDAGPCNMKEGNPDVIEKQNPGTSVIFSNIKWGDIGSTYKTN